MTHPLAGRALGLVRDVVLAGSVSVRHLGEDPLHFLLLAGRRLPSRVTAALARALTVGPDGPLRAALAAWLTDHPDRAAVALRGARPRGALGRRLHAELATQVGRGAGPLGATSGEPPAPHAAHDPVVARALWLAGDVSGALAVAPPSSGLAERYRSEAAVLRGEVRPRLPRAVAAGQPRHGDAPGALHVLTNSVPHTRSGYSARSHAVLRAQADAGIRVAAATRIAYPVSIGRLTSGRADVVDGVRYERLLPWTLPRGAEQRLERHAALLAPVARTFGPTVLHTTTDFTNALVTRAVAESSGTPWVYEVRGLLEDSWVARRTAAGDTASDTSERYGLLRARETESFLAADHVVTLSGTLADELVARGLDRTRITVVPNAVDERLLDDDVAAADARLRLGLPAEGFWVGTVSSLVDYEGLGTLLEAVALLRARGRDVRACVVGDGVSRPGLVRRAEELGLADAAVFPGRVGRDQAVLHHRALDVFAVPRRDVRVCRVVTPLKPVEAMACGRPVVASDLPALAEIVGEPGTGLLAPAGDAVAWAARLEELADDAALRARLGDAGRSFAAGRTWSRAGRVYRELYEGLAR
ncbi:glycosyltransferase [Cellulomonas carbonis]|nr:glycosyltransferase [Cellulomonas carbonis]GGC10766.1 glycosyltransferase WbuB [Cellulomonas carbonis]